MRFMVVAEIVFRFDLEVVAEKIKILVEFGMCYARSSEELDSEEYQQKDKLPELDHLQMMDEMKPSMLDQER